MVVNFTDILIGIATGAVALATFLLWRATVNVANATHATTNIAKEVATYSIIPRFEVVNHEREQQEGYHQYSFKLINNGKDTAYNVTVETKSNEKSSTVHVPFNITNREQIHLSHSVHPNEKVVNFKITFEDVAGNIHTKNISYELLNKKLMNERITWEQNKPFPDDVIT